MENCAYLRKNPGYAPATDMIVNFCKYKTALYKIFINEQLGLCAVSFKCCSVFLRL